VCARAKQGTAVGDHTAKEVPAMPSNASCLCVCVCFIGAALSQAALDSQGNFIPARYAVPPRLQHAHICTACRKRMQSMHGRLDAAVPGAAAFAPGPSLHLSLVCPGFGRPVSCVCMCVRCIGWCRRHVLGRVPQRVRCMRHHGVYLSAAGLPVTSRSTPTHHVLFFCT
jgi:hypothetical protein